MLYEILRCSLRKKRKWSDQKQSGMLTAVCKLLNIYNCHLNAYAKITGLRLKRSGLTKRMLNELNKTYDSVSYMTIMRLLDSYSDKAMERVTNWKDDNVHHCGDNVDVYLKSRHELQGHSSLDLHMYNNILYKHRTLLDHLSDVPPEVPPIEEIGLSQFIVNSSEQQSLMLHFERQIAKSWNSVDQLHEFVSELAADRPHSHSPEMKLKTEKVGVYSSSDCLRASSSCFIIMRYILHPSKCSDVYNLVDATLQFFFKFKGSVLRLHISKLLIILIL